MYALCADAWMRAAKRTLSAMEEEENITGGGANKMKSEGDPSSSSSAAVTVVVRGMDFAAALTELTPSLTDKDVAHYLRLRESFEGGRKKTL